MLTNALVVTFFARIAGSFINPFIMNNWLCTALYAEEIIWIFAKHDIDNTG
jgi:hypothetical protein